VLPPAALLMVDLPTRQATPAREQCARVSLAPHLLLRFCELGLQLLHVAHTNALLIAG
jgi:hypothetical protein